MLFFLFGWGHTSKKILDETPVQICEHCHADNLYLTKLTTWFTLFFIPIIPYEKEYYILCPNCDSGFELEGEQYKAD